MPFRVIRGTFHVQGYSPDGDSIRFKAAQRSHWDLLGGPPVRINSRDHAQIRLEAIDTLETHYGNSHQPLELAEGALDHLLAQLGISNVEWNPQRTSILSANDGTEGYIVSRQVEKYGRPVAFAFAGAPPVADGASLFLDEALTVQSANAEMLRSGLAYPTYYKGLFPDLRTALTNLVATARQQERGIWPRDRTNSGFEVTGLSSISEDHVIMPKLFRRLVAYLAGTGPVLGFENYLEDLQEEIFIISTAHATHFDTVVDVDGNVVRMTEPPENLIFEG